MRLFMDKSWIELSRATNEYLLGLEAFLDFSFANSGGG